ncbi:AraC family transcriptional regulator [Trinickia dinghuensis]|uniref:AraC family transcriptional regulator n=1 Tax=Trinickia dinghuensis TaxID=2291023 RepID=A0A3D8K6A0_9BURK|nr:AraC family transcriptional regulator [Trinickia dinghuensis]RDV00395.1 AraC family transcriptional regulator [Trinickia dinghuensis]
MDNLSRFYDGTPGAFRHFSVEFEGKVDTGHVIDTVGRAFKPHSMSIAGRAGELDATLRSLKIGGLQIFYLQYGAEVSVDPGELNGFTLVQMPVRGAARYSCGKQLVSGSNDVAAVISPQEATRFQFSADLSQVIVRIDQEALHRACIEHIDLLPERGLRFNPALDLNGPAGRAWCGALAYVLEGSVAFPDLLGMPSYAERCERLLIDTLILAQANNCSEYLNGMPGRRTVRPAYVKRAEDYMREHLADITSVDEIARTVGVSSRALFHAFRQTYDRSPMSYLRELRLKAVHAELKSGDPASVRLTDVAMRWGFSHYGHFSAHYRRRFGVRPQDTLNAPRS